MKNEEISTQQYSRPSDAYSISYYVFQCFLSWTINAIPPTLFSYYQEFSLDHLMKRMTFSSEDEFEVLDSVVSTIMLFNNRHNSTLASAFWTDK
jgi:hypothetical protein